LLIDITNLAQINHYHGYQTGDLVLKSTYDQLLSISKLPDSIYRMGDHRFAFILPELGNPAFIALAINKVSRVLEQALYVDSHLVSADVKVGVAVNREGKHDELSMLALAELSLALVKRGGGHRMQDFLGEQKDSDVTDHQLEQRFAQALQDNEFELYFQPKVNLRSGHVGSAEALLRWLPENSDPVSPEVVVGLADDAGKAYELTKWVVHSALRQAKPWCQGPDGGIALNLQASLVSNPDLPVLIKDALVIWGVEAERLTIEITESAIIEDKESGFNNLLKLKEMGINLSIDDFGTGYSSLSYFKHIPAAELKIDRSFVAKMLEDPQDLELVKIMITIAHQFSLKVVAEGVEDLETLRALMILDCDYAQGYYFSRPLPRQEFEAWVEQWPGLPEL
tara:strand:- start:108354 stop:109541 length:1188 start_codon:yes stop_codon:yes gene_type:complete